MAESISDDVAISFRHPLFISPHTSAKSKQQQSASRARLATVLLVFVLPVFCVAQAKRVVVVQCDGLAYDIVDRFARERDPRTGKSQLPWIDHIFYQRGTRL